MPRHGSREHRRLVAEAREVARSARPVSHRIEVQKEAGSSLIARLQGTVYCTRALVGAS